jgi:hypothetical protein
MVIRAARISAAGSPDLAACSCDPTVTAVETPSCGEAAAPRAAGRPVAGIAVWLPSVPGGEDESEQNELRNDRPVDAGLAMPSTHTKNSAQESLGRGERLRSWHLIGGYPPISLARSAGTGATLELTAADLDERDPDGGTRPVSFRTLAAVGEYASPNQTHQCAVRAERGTVPCRVQRPLGRAECGQHF